MYSIYACTGSARGVVAPSRNGSSYAPNANANIITKALFITGRQSGSTIWKNDCRGLAPRFLAASPSLSSMLDMKDITKYATKGASFHIYPIMTPALSLPKRIIGKSSGADTSPAAYISRESSPLWENIIMIKNATTVCGTSIGILIMSVIPAKILRDDLPLEDTITLQSATPATTETTDDMRAV